MRLAAEALGSVAISILCLGITQAQSPRKAAAAPKRAVTYSDDVATILNERCVSCHRPGEVAPFSLVGYDNAKKWSGMIAGTARKGIMPPWKAVKGYGEFVGENRLTPEQIETLVAWHEAGAPRGNASREPKPPTFPPPGAWSLGTPDLVLAPEKSFKLDAEGEDVYRNFVLKSDWKEPIYVKAMEVRPGNRKIVHHVIAFLDRNGQGRRLAAASKDGQEGYTSAGGGAGFVPSGSLGGWAPGTEPRYAPPGVAFKLMPGEEIVMQVHYHKSGKPEEDRTQLALYFAKEPIEKELELNWIFNFGINIPAGEKAYTARREITWRTDTTIYGAMPHMHLLGKSMKSWLELPDGTKKPLVFVDDWDFNWQFTYMLKEPIRVPGGTKLVVEAVYDNSSDNPRNPNNPPKRVTWGEATTDEMFLLIVPFTLEKKK